MYDEIVFGGVVGVGDGVKGVVGVVEVRGVGEDGVVGWGDGEVVKGVLVLFFFEYGVFFLDCC